MRDPSSSDRAEPDKLSPERSQQDRSKHSQRSGSLSSPRSPGSLKSPRSPVTGNSKRVQITLQRSSAVEEPGPRDYHIRSEPGPSISTRCDTDLRPRDYHIRTHSDVSRELSNSSNISELTSVDGVISPNPRAKRHRSSERYPSTSSVNKDQTKLASTLSPMIKRKVISAMQSVQANQSTLPPPKTNKFLALLTLLICPPLGCLAWHHARKVNKLISEDIGRARLASKMAATYSYIGFLIGGLILTAIFVTYVLLDAV